MTYTYKFVWWHEILFAVGHIVFGGIVAHALLCYWSLCWILHILTVIGFVRELIQWHYGKKQTWWISTFDALEHTLGGYIWYLIVTALNIDVGFI